jgi:uncharacterized membrane protein YfhO
LKDPSFDPERTVILSQGLPELVSNQSTATILRNEVAIEEHSVNAYDFRIQSQGRALLVVSQIYYPGWKALVDGERVPVVSANYALTGIPVPAGAHHVRLMFDPFSFKMGLAITIISMISIIGLAYLG